MIAGHANSPTRKRAQTRSRNCLGHMVIPWKSTRALPPFFEFGWWFEEFHHFLFSKGLSSSNFQRTIGWFPFQIDPKTSTTFCRLSESQKIVVGCTPIPTWGRAWEIPQKTRPIYIYIYSFCMYVFFSSPRIPSENTS